MEFITEYRVKNMVGLDLTEKKRGKTTAPNCPNCGRYLDKVVGWVCRKCGQIKNKEE